MDQPQMENGFSRTDHQMDLNNRLGLSQATPEYRISSPQERERSCLIWLMKAAEENLREDLAEPYYADSNGKQTIKPDYVLGLTSGELYAKALGQIYRSPIFLNFTIDEVLQFFLKRGYRLIGPTGEQITETDLSFSRPIRMAVHIPLIEALMRISKSSDSENAENVPTARSKRTVFAPLPNVTTWVDQNNSGIDEDSLPENSIQPSQSQALNIKLALEEKRRKLQSEHSKKGHEWMQQTSKTGENIFMKFGSQPTQTQSSASSASVEVNPEDHVYEEISENLDQPPSEEAPKESHRRAKWEDHDDGELDVSSMSPYSVRQPPKPLPRRNMNINNSETIVKRVRGQNDQSGVDFVRSGPESVSSPVGEPVPLSVEPVPKPGPKMKPKVIRNPPVTSMVNGTNTISIRSPVSDQARLPVIRREFTASINIFNPDEQETEKEPEIGNATALEFVENNFDDSDMEKKKQRLIMSAERRKREMEAMRRAKEQENMEKADLTRMQQEEQARKKEEERMRRQMIMEQYQKRKSETKSAEDHSFSRDAPPVVLRDTSKAKGRTRPLSVHANTVGDTLRSPMTENSVARMKRSPSQGDVMRATQELSILSLHNPRLAAASARHSQGNERRAHSPPPMHYRSPLDSNLSDAGSSNSGGQEIYNGPKLFKKPAIKSNRQLIHNAIRDSCLKTEVDKPMRNRALDALGRTDGTHFLVLFREGIFKGLYSFDPDRSEATKFFGVGPQRIDDSMTDKLLQYNSGTKTFKPIPTTHHMSVQIDGITLQSAIWTGKKAVGIKPPLEMF